MHLNDKKGKLRLPNIHEILLYCVHCFSGFGSLGILLSVKSFLF